MIYFDINLLNQYLETGLDVKVFVDREYYTITSKSDLSPSDGMVSAYNIKGQQKIFHFKDIEKVRVGDSSLDIKSLNDLVSPKQSSDNSSDQSKDSKGKLPKPGDGGKKENQIYIGRPIINNDKSSPYYGSKGLISDVNENLVFYKTLINNNFKTIAVNIKKIKVYED